MSNDETQESPDRPAPTADPSFGAPDAPPQNLPATAPKREPVLAGERGIQIRSLADLAQFSKMIFDSGMAPKGFKTPQSVAVAVQKGLEHGLLPLQALQSVYVVNSMPAWTGKAALGLVLSSGLMVPGSYRSWIEGEGDKMVAWCESRRVGGALVRTSFSVDDAKTAKLWQKRGRDQADTPWITFPKRMLSWKVISHHLNDVYPDVLGGMPIAEDVIDIPSSREYSTEPRKSLLGAVTGPVIEDKLLSGALSDVPPTVAAIEVPVTDSAPATEETDKTDKTGEIDFEALDALDKKERAQAEKNVVWDAKTEGRFRDLLAALDDAEDFADLERKTFKALTAAGQNKAWEKEVHAQAKRLAKKFPQPKQ